MSTVVQTQVSMTKLSRFLRLTRGSPKLIIGIVVFLLLAGIAIFEPAINNARLDGQRSTEIGNYDMLLEVSAKHPLGTDHYGRDMLALLFTGLRNSLMIGLVAGALATVIAVLMATTAGYIGGRVEAIITAVTNAVLIIPSWPIIAIIVVFVDRVSIMFLALLLAFFSWPWPTRQMAPQISSMKERPYVDLAKISGFGSWSIMFKEVLPNFLPFIVLGFTYAVSGNIIAETGLRLVGLGPGEITSLGQLINWALYTGTMAQGYYIIALSPIVLLVLIFVSLNFINLGLEEVYNPRLKKITGV
jgi:peptide/nickel transport system permease protein